MDTYALESFIDFCDDMQIAQEGSIKESFKKVKDWLIEQFQKLLEWFKSKIRKLQEKRLEKKIDRRLKKLEKKIIDGLKRVKASTTEEELNDLNRLRDEIVDEANYIFNNDPRLRGI